MSENKKTVTASPVMKRSPALDYDIPVVTKIATKIDAVDPAFIPKPSEELNSTDAMVSAKLNSQLRLPHRGSAEVSCGFSIEIPPGYRIVLSAYTPMAAKGLLVTTPHFYGKGEDVKVNVLNVGREILTIDDKQVFALMSIQPVYSFEWINND